MSVGHRTNPRCDGAHRGHRPNVDSKEIRARSFKIRNTWSDEEKARRAYTARLVQWLLLGPPVGFRLEAE